MGTVQHFKRIVPLICLVSLAQVLYSADEDAYQAVLNTISGDSLKRHVWFLGHDSLEGRATGSRGESIAAAYIAGTLERLLLKPLGEDGSYYQFIPMHGSIPLAESQLRFWLKDQLTDLELGRDYLLYKTGAQTYIPNPVEMVFAGYGIHAPEFDYDDYRSIEPAGKIVVFLSGEPHSDDPAYFEGENPTIYAYPEAKQRIAISRGALGSILIPNPLRNKNQYWEALRREFAFEDVTLAYTATGHLSLMINPAVAPRLFEDAPFTFKEILEMDYLNRIESFPLAGSISFKGEFISRDFLTANLIGMLEGEDPELKNTCLIISAHYDHLGIGPPVNNDSIYNGVFDNATGVAAALELARAFSQLSRKPRRSVIFLFVTGEEKGLLGSRYYLDNPVVALHKTVANVNIDGLAMFDTFNDVIGIGAELSELGDYLEKAAKQEGLKVSPLPREFSSSRSFLRSDQIAFAQAGIPSILIMDGLHYQNMSTAEALVKNLTWNDTVYHTPFDDLHQSMNFDAAVEHCRFIFAYCYAIANSTSEVEWKPRVPYLNVRLQTRAEKR